MSGVQFTSRFGEVTAQLLAAQRRAAERTGAWAADLAQSLAPVDTGELRDSISYEVQHTLTGSVLIVFAGTDHALYVEFGTSRMSAQPFLRPVLDRIGATYQQFLSEEIAAVH